MSIKTRDCILLFTTSGFFIFLINYNRNIDYDKKKKSGLRDIWWGG